MESRNRRRGKKNLREEKGGEEDSASLFILGRKAGWRIEDDLYWEIVHLSLSIHE